MWPKNFDEFCELKGCKHMCSEYRTAGYGMQDAKAVSCMLIGPSMHITEYPDNCPYIDEIVEYEGRQYANSRD